MPKVKINGKVKKFPYTQKGMKSAKQAIKNVTKKKRK